MQKLFTTLLLISLSFTGFSQMETEEELKYKFLTNVPITINPEAYQITGSAYENDNFAMGKVYKNGQVVATNVALRYNALRDEFEVKPNLDTPDASAKVMMRHPDIYVKILNKVFVYADPKNNEDRPGYYLVLFEGDNADLYKKISKEFIEGMEATTSLTRDIPSSYKDKTAFYLLNKNTNIFQEFPNSRNAKFGLFKDKKKELKKYAKENRLNINKQTALLKLVKYYNTL